jgi:hypothetical protein
MSTVRRTVTADDPTVPYPPLPVHPDDELGHERPAIQKQPANSWEPVDLSTFEAITEPPTIGGIVYAGRRHLFSGEPESMKSLVALMLAVDETRAGKHVVWISLESESDGRETVSRFRELGGTEQDLARFHFVAPEAPIGSPGARETLDRLIETTRPTLVVVDAYIGVLDLHGLDPTLAIDIEKIGRLLFRPLERHGAATIVLDHLAKNRETRGKFSIGSERKVGAVAVHLGLEVVTPLRRGGHGLVKLRVHKDKPAHLHRPYACEIRFESDTAGDLTWDVRHPPSEPEPDTLDSPPFRPTNLMKKVSRYLEQQTGPVSRTTITNAVPGKKTAKLLAIDRLIAEGYASEEDGSRNSRPVTHVKPYREADDPFPPVPDPFPTSSQERDRRPVPRSPSLQGGNGNESVDDQELDRLEQLGNQLGLTGGNA